MCILMKTSILMIHSLCVTKFPLKFNKISAYRYQQVLPYYNVATDEGIKSVYNADYDRAQYTLTLINHRRYLKVLPFRAEALNAEMPFLVRDYGGKWTFATNDLGADSRGRPIDNTRKNKGKFIADFDVAVKPERPEFCTLFFHLTDTMPITIIGVSNSDPGYPDQDYTMANAPCGCDSYMTFVAEANQGGRYAVAANTIRVNGAAITHTAIDAASQGAFVTALQAAWTAASLEGTWSSVDGTARTFKITWAANQIDQGSIEIPFLLT